MEPESDAGLLASSIASPERFSAFYERHLDAVARYLARRVGGELAEDLTAEVFVRAFRVRDRYRPQHDSALPWLLGIAGHLIADHRRAERRRLALLERLADSPAGAVPGAGGTRGVGAPPEDGGLASDLGAALRQMPKRDRDALLLVAWGELSYLEAAEALGVPIGTVRSRIARARSRLTAALGEPRTTAVPSPGGHT